jgi:hypothetical protein
MLNANLLAGLRVILPTHNDLPFLRVRLSALLLPPSEGKCKHGLHYHPDIKRLV